MGIVKIIFTSTGGDGKVRSLFSQARPFFVGTFFFGSISGDNKIQHSSTLK